MRTAILAAMVTLSAGCSAGPSAPERVSSTTSALDAVPSFGSNPGNLQMFRYVPQGVSSGAPLVVVMHGCTQTAEQMSGSGWNALADKYKFYLVYPQQQSANNPSTCFDWFGQYNNPANKANITRGQGEDESIKEMVDKMKADYSIDASRVFVVGFSAGGAMAAALLATRPEVFAAGGIAAGVPYNCPSTQNIDVFQCMNPGKTQTAAQWGTTALAGDNGYAGPWPRVSIWQGSTDTTVATANSVELVKQWTNVHGLSQTPTSSDTVATYPHDIFKDANGRVIVERYSITGMDHAYAIDPSSGCGTAAQYLEDKKICTALYMAKFFGIAGANDPLDGGADADTDAAARDSGTIGDAATDAGGGGASDSGSGGHADSGGGAIDSGPGSGPGSAGGTDSGARGGGAGGCGGGATADGGNGATDDGGGIAGCDLGGSGGGGGPGSVAPGLFLAAAMIARRRRR